MLAGLWDTAGVNGSGLYVFIIKQPDYRSQGEIV
jgi:hypothetical protein